MSIIVCPNCRTRVLAGDGESCPSCRRNFATGAYLPGFGPPEMPRSWGSKPTDWTDLRRVLKAVALLALGATAEIALPVFPTDTPRWLFAVAIATCLYGISELTVGLQVLRSRIRVGPLVGLAALAAGAAGLYVGFFSFRVIDTLAATAHDFYAMVRAGRRTDADLFAILQRWRPAEILHRPLDFPTSLRLGAWFLGTCYAIGEACRVMVRFGSHAPNTPSPGAWLSRQVS